MFGTQAHPNETWGSCVPHHCNEKVNYFSSYKYSIKDASLLKLFIIMRLS